MPADPSPMAVRIIDDRWTVFRHAIEALAIVAAGIWAFYTFVYQEKIKPAQEPAALAPTIEVRRIGRDAKREILAVFAHLRNTGKTEIQIAADAYNVWGDAYGQRESTADRSGSNRRRYFHGIARTSRKLILTAAELRDRAVGGRTDLDIVIEPGAETTFAEVIVVPRGAYDVIHAQVIAVPVKRGAQRVRVAIARDKDGSAWLEPAPAEASEEDSESNFALSS